VRHCRRHRAVYTASPTRSREGTVHRRRHQRAVHTTPPRRGYSLLSPCVVASERSTPCLRRRGSPAAFTRWPGWSTYL
jgi:hypothetical protein